MGVVVLDGFRVDIEAIVRINCDVLLRQFESRIASLGGNVYEKRRDQAFEAFRSQKCPKRSEVPKE